MSLESGTPPLHVKFSEQPVQKETSLERYYRSLHTIITDIQSVAKGNQGWWIIGGVARDALMGTEPQVITPEGEMKDIDIIFSEPLQTLGAKLQQRNQTPIWIGTSMQNVVKVTPEKEAKLVLGGVQVGVSLRVFDTKMVKLGPVEFPTLPATTLFHLYCAGYRPQRHMRSKDFSNALTLARFIRTHPDPRYVESQYTAFHRFAHEVNGPRRSMSLHVMDIVHAYLHSPLNDVLPLNNPRIRRPLEKAWATFEALQKPSVKQQ